MLRQADLPPHWNHFKASQPIVIDMIQLLNKGRKILSEIEFCQDHSNGQSLKRFYRAVTNSEALSIVKNRIIEMMNEVMKDLMSVDRQQRKLTQVLMEQMQIELDINMEINQAHQNQAAIAEYKQYFASQRRKSLKSQLAFIQQQLASRKHQRQLVSFYQRVPSNQQQPMNDDINHQEQPIQANRLFRTEEEKQSDNLFYTRLQQFQQRLKEFSRLFSQRNPILEQTRPHQIILPVIVLAIPILIASLIVNSDNTEFSQKKQAWIAPAFCISYYWINYYLLYYCLKKGANLIMGRNCQSYEQIIFYKDYYCLRNYLFLTLAYIVFLASLLTALYLQSFKQSISLIIVMNNAMFIVFFIAEIVYKRRFIPLLIVLQNKFSFLHSTTMLISMVEIVCTIFGVGLGQPIGEYSKIIVMKVVDISTILLICIVELIKGYKQQKLKQLALFIGLLLLTILFHVLAIFYPLNVIVIFSKIVIRFIMLSILVAIKYQLVLTNSNYLQSLIQFFQSFLKSQQNGRKQNRIAFEVLAMRSYPRWLKALFLATSICYILFLLFFVELCQRQILSKYITQAILIIGYLIFNVSYVNQVDLHFRHPLSSLTRLTITIQIPNTQNLNRIFTINNERYQMNENDESSKILDERDKKLREVQKKWQRMRETQKKLGCIRKQLPQVKCDVQLDVQLDIETE